MRRAAAAALAAALAAAVGTASCDGAGDDDPAGAAPAAAHAPGTVLAVSGVPIRAEDVEAVAALVARVRPGRTEPALRREALETLLLPRAAVRAAYPEARAEALARAEAARAELLAAGAAPLGPDPPVWEGGPSELGPLLWAWLQQREAGAWSEPWERIGAFVVARLEERRPDGRTLAARIAEFPYVPPDFAPQDLERALAASRLEVVDPAFDRYLPEALRYAMRGSER